MKAILKLNTGIMVSCIIFLSNSCVSSGKGNVKTTDKTKAEQARKLVNEADSILKCDTAFWNNTMKSKCAHSASEDKLILQKLDSAIMLCPDSKDAYIRKYTYLVSCRKPEGLLPLLNEMDSKCDSMQGDYLCLKGLLEYHYGDSINGNNSFRRADEAFQFQIDQCMSSDSLMYGSLKLSKALNLSLMKNDFSIFRSELRIFRKVYPHTGIGGLEKLQDMKNREDYYSMLFNDGR